MTAFQTFMVQQSVVVFVGGTLGILLSWTLYRLFMGHRNLSILRLLVLVALGLAYYTSIFALTVVCVSADAAIADSNFIGVVAVVAVIHNRVFLFGLLLPPVTGSAQTDGGIT